MKTITTPTGRIVSRKDTKRRDRIRTLVIVGMILLYIAIAAALGLFFKEALEREIINNNPYCPEEDSCTADYQRDDNGEGNWVIEEATP